MFDLRNFVKNGLLKAVGSLPDFQIILTAAEWHTKAVLYEEDLEDINHAIELKNYNNRNQ